MKNKLLHIVGGGYNQIPLAKMAKELGLRLLITDMYENPPCRQYADHYEQIDTTNKEKTLQAALKYKPDAIITDQTDVAVPTVAFVADELGLPGIGYETALKFTNKYLMRQVLKPLIPESIPDFYYFDEVEEATIFFKTLNPKNKYIIKPVNSQGSKGVYKLDQVNFEKLISQAFVESRGRGVLLEQFIEGFEFSVEGYKSNDKYHSLAVTKKYHFASNDCIDERNTYLADISEELEKELFETNEKIVNLLGLPFGITHAEYKVHEGKAYLIEIAARGGGGSISSKIIPFLTEFYPAKALLHRVFNEPYEIKYSNYKDKFAVLKFFHFKPGTVKNVYVDNEIIKDLLEYNLDLKKGDLIKEVKDSRDRPGYFVVAGTDRLKVIETEKLVESSVQIEYE